MKEQKRQMFIGLSVICLLILLVYQKNCVQAFSKITLCAQEGTTLNYECTVSDTLGIGSTIWQGDRFNCTEVNNQIALSHNHYRSGQSGVCGDFSAASVGVNGSEYTSRLTIHTSMLINTIINCTVL